MKRAALLCILLALTATAASAAPGVNLRWTNCFGDGGESNRTFACDSNTGSNVLVASFVLPADLPHGAAAQVVIDLATASPRLPDWWKFVLPLLPSNCRPFAALMAQAQDGTNCPDWAVGQASFEMVAYNEGAVGGYNTAEISIANSVSLDRVHDLFAGQEYGVARLTINNLKTVGTGSCAGCLVPACIVNRLVEMFSSDNDNSGSSVHIRMSGPTNGTDSNLAMWQNGASIVVSDKIVCPPAAVPVRKSTWGVVKTLYR